jgi:hypothetical protein
MKRVTHTIVVFIVFLIFLLNVRSSLAQSEYTIFGPKQYDKPKGSPVTYTDSFQGYKDIGYTLWVQSGQDGLNEVKNVSVSINGAEVLDSSDLRKSNPTTKTISLQSNNTLKLVLKGQGGNFITVKVLAPPLNIISISPASGETILKPEITVTGRVINFTGNETGVTVNGKVANVYGNQFVANNVSLVEGANTITVTAKDMANNSATASVTVNAVTTGGYIELSSNIESGIAPLTANFSASTSSVTPASYQLDYEGDGVVDYTGTTFENISHIYTTEGIFYPTVTVTDNQGNTYSDTIAITVMNKTEIDTLLKEKWEGMKEALRSGDVETALFYFLNQYRDGLREAFTIMKDKISINLSLQDELNLIDIYDDIANYENVVYETNGIYSYPVLFIKSEDGIWKLRSF